MCLICKYLYMYVQYVVFYVTRTCKLPTVNRSNNNLLNFRMTKSTVKRWLQLIIQWLDICDDHGTPVRSIESNWFNLRLISLPMPVRNVQCYTVYSAFSSWTWTVLFTTPSILKYKYEAAYITRKKVKIHFFY